MTYKELTRSCQLPNIQPSKLCRRQIPLGCISKYAQQSICILRKYLHCFYLFATIGKKKGAGLDDCCPKASPNARIYTTMKPTPGGASIHFKLLIYAQKFWRFLGAHQAKANTSFMSMSLLYVNYLIHC